jgi:hypothetical protein
MPIAPFVHSTTFEFQQRVSGITAAGQQILSASTGRSRLVVHNAGTVAIQLFYNATGTGDPIVTLPASGVLDNGTGGTWTDPDWQGALWIKAPAGGGNALISAY